ncbi:plasmid transfer protein [Bacteroides sp. 1_1_14]|nr:plasmid transfer protein [Bacteroides sp. 1_1_14]
MPLFNYTYIEMTLYIILCFVALCAGMALSVYAFGTGGKRKRIFQDIYFSAEETDGVGVLYTKTGEYSAVLKIENPVQKYSADIDSYYDFTHLFTALAQTLGEGYAIHKQDIFVRKQFASEPADGQEFLSASYFRYFKGRPYTDSLCYLTITQEAKKSRLFSFDNKKWRDFLVKIRKVHDQLHDSGVQARFLNKAEASEYVDRYFAMNFKDRTVSMTNFKADDETVSMGDKRCKVYSLVDVDCAALPSMIRPYTNIEVNNTEMPVDLASVVDNIPDAETVVYNQVIFLPNQKRELAMLDKKKNRHASIPNPNNQMAVEDIKRVQEVIARESKQLVYTHFNMVVAVSAGADLQKCTNHLENAFGRMGIHISKRAYNQLELFVGSFPGNCYTLNEEYDRFLTLSDAAMCLMYKERVLHSEETPLKIYYTDRQGVPVAIDITGKEGKNKLTDNSNFFCLGPSGSGKSFHINSVVRQLHEQGTDVVMVDTGNSYEGLCEYLGGKYISYTEERPITMNPFRINREEYNIEKIDFLKNLILMIWKGSDSQIPEIEFRIVEQIIIDYYDAYFNGFTRYTDEQREVLLKNLFAAASRKNPNKPPREVDEMVRKQIEVLEARRAALKVTELSFNSFFDYSFDRLEQICTENDITTISYSTYSTMLQPFYKGGAYEKILNETVDSALFDETFIVFEVDAIKENKKLFPIVTLIIMDVFLQKMRIKKNRKVLVIEEAWKAIASPLMAEYIKFMYKTARKFWASVGVVTQEIQDIIGSEIVKEAIINNSDVVMLLDQSKFKERFDEIRKILGLTEVDCKKIFTINRLENKDGRSFFREVFIRRGTTSGVYGVEEPHECYMTYTTERAEKEALKLYKKELRCSHQEAIEAYCRDWDASGIGKSLPFAQKVNETGRVLNLRPVYESK